MDTKIKVMYLDPLAVSKEHLQIFVNMVEQYKYPFTDAYITSLSPDTAPPKLTNLEYRLYEAYTDLETVKVARYCGQNSFDGMVIGCFYDPSLDACREISEDCTVVAPCQSSCQAALTISNKFSVIVGRNKWVDQMKANVLAYGYRHQLASFEAVDLGVRDFQVDHNHTKNRLMDAAIKGIKDHGAQSIILGCTLEIGFYTELMAELEDYFGFRVPVVDPAIAAFKAAENNAIQAKIGWKTSRAWGMEPPSEDELKRFNILQTDYNFGHYINIPPKIV